MFYDELLYDPYLDLGLYDPYYGVPEPYIDPYAFLPPTIPMPTMPIAPQVSPEQLKKEAALMKKAAEVVDALAKELEKRPGLAALLREIL